MFLVLLIQHGAETQQTHGLLLLRWQMKVLYQVMLGYSAPWCQTHLLTCFHISLLYLSHTETQQTWQPISLSSVNRNQGKPVCIYLNISKSIQQLVCAAKLIKHNKSVLFVKVPYCWSYTIKGWNQEQEPVHLYLWVYHIIKSNRITSICTLFDTAWKETWPTHRNLLLLHLLRRLCFASLIKNHRFHQPSQTKTCCFVVVF